MTRARPIHEGQFYLLTRRCTQRLFLLRPDDATNQTWHYCLAVAAARYEVEVIFTSVLSNHHHTILFDRHARIVEFTEHLHKLVARAMNALRDRAENFWSSEAPSLVRLVEPEDVMAKLVYAATNPVKDDLVERVHHWPGVNAYRDFVKDRTVEVVRPRHFFRPDGDLPAVATLRFVVPPELGADAAIRSAVRDAVATRERELITARRREGRRVVGRRRILGQSCQARPTTPAPRGRLNPRIAARSLAARVAALRELRQFLTVYRAARHDLLAGRPSVFPPGTYWLRRFANVTVSATLLSPT